MVPTSVNEILEQMFHKNIFEVFYLHRNCFDEQHILVPQVQTFTNKTRHSMDTMAIHAHSFRISLVKKKEVSFF